MSITSLDCLLFAIIIVIAYFAVPKKAQWLVICAANVFFYCCSGVRYIIFILLCSVVTWYMALKIDMVSEMGGKLLSICDSQTDKSEVRNNITSIKKILCGVAIVLSMGGWIILKYSNFFIENINRIIQAVGKTSSINNVSWVLPIGISFYTFDAVGYVVDVYRKKYPAEKNFLRYFAFVSYFPHIIQGPFSRYDALGKSMREEHYFSYDRLCRGCARILWGLVKKLVVADLIGPSVTEVLNNYMNYTGTHVIFAFFAYAIQLYADFSGYMDMVCGFSDILGIALEENFRQPYFARTVDEYWRRWHITLGKWFKDYVFMPVSMGKFAQKLGRKARTKWGAKMGKLVPGYFALIFVWTATGLWHGAAWKYLAWGYLNLLVIISTMQLGSFYDKVKAKLHINSRHWLWQLFCIVRTFFLVCFFRFFSVANSLRDALNMIKFSITNFSVHVLLKPSEFFVEASNQDIFLITIGVVLMLIVDILKECNKWEEFKEKCPFVVRDIIYVSFIMALILFAGGDNDLVGGFMYAKF